MGIIIYTHEKHHTVAFYSFHLSYLIFVVGVLHCGSHLQGQNLHSTGAAVLHLPVSPGTTTVVTFPKSLLSPPTPTLSNSYLSFKKI